MTAPERIRVQDVARITGLLPRAIQGLAAQGKIPGAGKLGGSWTFDEVKVRRWVRQQEIEACRERTTYTALRAQLPAEDRT